MGKTAKWKGSRRFWAAIGLGALVAAELVYAAVGTMDTPFRGSEGELLTAGPMGWGALKLMFTVPLLIAEFVLHLF